MPETYEYTRFGDGILRRKKDSTDDWKPVPESDQVNAMAEIKMQEKLRAENKRRGAQSSVKFIR